MIQTVFQQQPISVQRPGEQLARTTNLETPSPLQQGVFETPHMVKTIGQGPKAETPYHAHPVPPATPFGLQPDRFEDPVIKRATIPAPDGPVASNIPGVSDKPWNSMQQEVQANLERMHVEMVEKPKEKANILFEGRNRLQEEARRLGGEVRLAVGNLMKSRELALRLNALLVRYQTKLDKDTAVLPIPDQVQLRQELTVKLMAELEGIRLPSDKFATIQKANPEVIDEVIRKVKAKLMV